jgi:hypothetical protein
MLGLLFMAVWLGAVSPAWASGMAAVEVQSGVAFTVPERLEYAISWVGIPVGESSLAVSDIVRLEHGEAYHFVSTARSNHVLRLLYPVKTRIESFVDTERMLPVRYTMTGRQGFKTRNRELRFDQMSHQVELIMAGMQRVYPTVDAVQDPLSALYFYRTRAAVTPGEVVRIPVHDRKRPHEIVITTGQVETITTRAGTFEAARLNVKQTEEGLFLHEGDITLWVTTDARRLPVRMLGRVMIGTVEAELLSVIPAPEPVVEP